MRRVSAPAGPSFETPAAQAPQDEGKGVKSQTPALLFAHPLDIPSELLYRRGLNLQQDAEIQRLGQATMAKACNGRS